MSIVDSTPPPYYPDLPADHISEHPKNPRHNATADDDMVASVRTSGILEPLIVAPIEPGSDRFILIAGHRRLDAAAKAGRATVPARVMYDLVTEGQQIEAMIVENGHREDLTSIEEAEGYHQLELLGYKAPAIATAVGRDVKTVRSRLKLLNLSPSTRSKVQSGQVTLENAAAMVEFAADPNESKRLEAAAGTPNFSYELSSARRRRESAQAAATAIAALLELGATEVKLKKGWYETDQAKRGGVELYATHSDEPSDHDGCLAYVHEVTDYTSRVRAICTKPDAHQAKLAAAERRRLAELKRRDAEADAAEAATSTARSLRLGSVWSAAEAVNLPPVYTDLFRALLPALLRQLHDGHLAIYFDRMGLEPGQQWKSYMTAKKDKAAFAEHTEDLRSATPATIAKAIVAAVAALTESVLTNTYAREPLATELVAYLDTLEHLGHPMCDVDNDLRAQLAGTTDETPAEVA